MKQYQHTKWHHYTKWHQHTKRRLDTKRHQDMERHRSRNGIEQHFYVDWKKDMKWHHDWIKDYKLRLRPLSEKQKQNKFA